MATTPVPAPAPAPISIANEPEHRPSHPADRHVRGCPGESRPSACDMVDGVRRTVTYQPSATVGIELVSQTGTHGVASLTGSGVHPFSCRAARFTKSGHDLLLDSASCAALGGGGASLTLD